ncbi:hypothetical protein [Deinococcus aestuarii]|uniref:hypothetical protein n=1 Tax=Deinococcus aestuarii TaxID=2774531 RepID=UPI001C0D25F5|nr:hypothetical protein [Deinococcus aestuarii]
MTHPALRSLALTLPLLLAACGGTTPGTTTSTGGSNQAPEASILSASGARLGTGVVVGPSAQFTLNVSDADGSVRVIEWTVTQGPKTLSSGKLSGDEVKARLPLTLPTLAGGTYTLTVKVTDDGGATASAQTGFTVDATAPVLGPVALNGTALADGASTTLVVGASGTLTASATDNAAGVTLNVYRGSTLFASGTGSVTADLSGGAAGSTAYTVVAVDAVGNSTSRAFTVNYQANSKETPAPTPVLLINNTGAQPYSNVLSVTASAGVAPGIALKQLILEVTDANGIVDTTTYTASSENATFNIDTTKFPDGALKLRAIAIDATDQRGTSGVNTVQISNLVAPTLTIVSPTNGGSVTGITDVTIQVRRNNTGFDFTAQTDNVALDVIDSRGQLVTTQTGTLSKVNEGLYQATLSVDFNATQYLNGAYTLKARTNVLLSGESTARTLTAVNDVSNLSRVGVPPALNIILPAFYGDDPNSPQSGKRPVLTRKSAIAVQVSDSDAIQQVQLQFTCDQATRLPTQSCNTSAYNFNFPIGEAGLFYRVFDTGVLIDGQPFVENGNYVMRVTATDAAGNSNIKEINVVVDRSSAGIANLGPVVTTTFESAASKYTPASALWRVQGTNVNPVRIISLWYDGGGEGLSREIPTLVGIETDAAPGSVIGSGTSFNKAGSYRQDFLVQDLVTGVVELYPGGLVNVSEK